MNSMLRRWRQAAINAGVEIPDGTSLYRPGGYPRLGLVPLSVKLSTRSMAKLERQLITHEHRRGNVKFTATGLSKLDIRLANELVSVYLGLAERFRNVWIESINFSSNITAYGQGTRGITRSFATDFPNLYAVAQDMGEFDPREVLDAVYCDEYDRNTFARVHREMVYAPWSIYHRDALSHGTIDLSEHNGHPECSAVYHAVAVARNLARIQNGQPLSWPPMRTSVMSSVFIHEFGHAVENALVALGPESHRHVLEVLESCILRNPNGNGRWRVSDRKLKAAGLTRADARLVNYPAAFDPDNAGNGAWRRVLREVVGWEMAREIGFYASEWRDECFAEAFTQSIITAVPETKRQLAPFQEALYDVGLSVKRRRNV